jgi:hypothetical protein
MRHAKIELRRTTTLVEFSISVAFLPQKIAQRAPHAPPTCVFLDHVNFDTIVCVMLMLDRA